MHGDIMLLQSDMEVRRTLKCGVCDASVREVRPPLLAHTLPECPCSRGVGTHSRGRSLRTMSRSPSTRPQRRGTNCGASTMPKSWTRSASRTMLLQRPMFQKPSLSFFSSLHRPDFKARCPLRRHQPNKTASSSLLLSCLPPRPPRPRLSASLSFVALPRFSCPPQPHLMSTIPDHPSLTPTHLHRSAPKRWTRTASSSSAMAPRAQSGLARTRQELNQSTNQ